MSYPDNLQWTQDSLVQTDNVVKIEPILKWPGGKRGLIRHLLPLIPNKFASYYEPFFGGGALFFALRPKAAILADKNGELINCYSQLRSSPSELLELLQLMKNTKEDYYAIRTTAPRDERARAARFIYLMTLSFNGIYRENLQGEFNVPYGNKQHLAVYDREKFYRVSKALQPAQLFCADFDITLALAKQNDLVYLDPPYTTAYGNDGFLKYNAEIFSWEDQIRLADTANKLANKGCHVIISNADHPSIHSLYRDFQVRTVVRQSTIAASRSHRREIKECIFYSQKGS